MLIRHPRPTIASALQYTPEVRPRSAIGAYGRYYTRVLPLIDDVIVATFEEVTTDFGAVITQCNERYGTNFVPFERSPESDAEVLKTIDAATEIVAPPDRVSNVLPRPTAARRPAAEFLASLEPSFGPALDALEALYEEVVSARVGPGST